MNVTIELWQLITLLLAFFAFVGACFKVFLTQVDKRLAAQFESIGQQLKAQEDKRAEASRAWDRRFENLEQMEREFLKFQAELPVLYVRRDDYIRGQTVLEAKQDALYQKMENVQLQVANALQRSPQQ